MKNQNCLQSNCILLFTGILEHLKANESWGLLNELFTTFSDSVYNGILCSSCFQNLNLFSVIILTSQLPQISPEISSQYCQFIPLLMAIINSINQLLNEKNLEINILNQKNSSLMDENKQLKSEKETAVENLNVQLKNERDKNSKLIDQLKSQISNAIKLNLYFNYCGMYI